MLQQSRLTVIPPPLALSQVDTILVDRYLAPLKQGLRDFVLAGLGALLDEVSCCAVGDVRLCHQWSFFTQLLGEASHARRNARVRLLDCFGSDIG